MIVNLPGASSSFLRHSILLLLGLGSSLFIAQSRAYSQPTPNPQSAPARPARQATLVPASRSQLQAYQQQAALSICYLVKRNVDFKTALTANTAAVMIILKDKHGNTIAPSTAPLDQNKLVPLLSIDITINAVNSCPKVIPQQVRDEVEQLTLKIKRSLKGSAATKNGQ